MGSMYVFMIFTGISNCSSVLPFITTQRIIVYRERFARMYSSWAYSLAQVQKFIKSLLSIYKYYEIFEGHIS